MEDIPVKQLFKTAALTAPLIALMFVTPIFLLTNGLHNYNFITLFLVVSCGVFFAWTLNIVFVLKRITSWIQTWRRTILVTAIMYFVSLLVFVFLEPKLKIEFVKVEIIRFSNILAINAIIYILMDLLLTKENESKYALENANLKLVKLEAEFKLLKDQINPHFLFNALSTAKSLIKKQPQLAEEYIVRLSEFLRASINNNRTTVAIKEELELCGGFIALNKIRFGDALKYEVKVSDSTLIQTVPYFSLLTLVENAIKHNSFTLEKPLQIEITSEANYLEVKNNKQGKFVLEEPLRTGLKNLNDRYKLLNAETIIVSDLSESFIVKIPILNK